MQAAQHLTTEELREDHAREITKEVGSCVYQMGLKLIECRRLSASGEWRAWVESRFSFSYATACRAMKVADVLSDDEGNCLVPDFAMHHLQETALHAISQDSCPQSVRIGVIHEAGLGKLITGESVRKLITEKKGKPPNVAPCDTSDVLSETTEEPIAGPKQERDSTDQALLNRIDDGAQEDEQEDVPDVINLLYEIRLTLPSCSAEDVSSVLSLVVELVGMDPLIAAIKKGHDMADQCPVCAAKRVKKKATKKRKPSQKSKAVILRDGFARFWKISWRKIAVERAEKAFTKACESLVKKNGWELPRAVDYIIERAEAFASTPVGMSGKFAPYPASWLNAGQYDDDPAEWEKGDKEQAGPTPEEIEAQKRREKRLAEKRAIQLNLARKGMG
jgi:hypothetical protein